MATRRNLLLDGDSNEAAVFGPAPIVVLDLGETEELGQDEPAVARTLADATVGHDIRIGRDALGLVELLKLVGGFEGAVVVDRLGPGDVGRTRNVPGDLGLLL